MMKYIMQVIIVAFATMVLGVGILANDHTQTSDDLLSAKETLIEEETVLGKEVTPTPTATPEAFESEQTNSSISEYIYPGSTIVSSRNNYLELESKTDSDTITEWYKNLIKQNNFSVKSSVSTKTNGVVDNKIIGSENGTTIEINISQPNSSSTVLITVRKT